MKKEKKIQNENYRTINFNLPFKLIVSNFK